MTEENNEVEYITAGKRKELKAELEELGANKRKEILEKLEFAKSLGDLSENAEYQQAREEQAKLEERVSEIKHILKSSVVVSKHHSNKVEVGTTIIVQKKGAKEKQTYQIVGSEEADMEQGKISYKSPLGEALFGNKKGDKVTISTPNGEVQYKILDIE